MKAPTVFIRRRSVFRSDNALFRRRSSHRTSRKVRLHFYRLPGCYHPLKAAIPPLSPMQIHIAFDTSLVFLPTPNSKLPEMRQRFPTKSVFICPIRVIRVPGSSIRAPGSSSGGGFGRKNYLGVSGKGSQRFWKKSGNVFRKDAKAFRREKKTVFPGQGNLGRARRNGEKKQGRSEGKGRLSGHRKRVGEGEGCRLIRALGGGVSLECYSY